MSSVSWVFAATAAARGEDAAKPALATTATAPAPAIEGLWSGVIFLKRGSMEAEAFVEFNRDHEGALGGTITLPAYQLKYLPIENLTIDDSAISFSFTRFSARANVDVVSPISGTLSADGQTIEGEYVEGGVNTYPITLTKIGPEGTELPTREPGELLALSADSHELAEAFNADRDKVRALLLVSPTCPICLNKARMLQRYLLDRVSSEDLALYLVWGPMQGNETEEAAQQATASLVDPRVRHYWTPVHDIANAYMKPLGLENDVEPAWDTYMVFGAGILWGEHVPTPTYFMWEEKPLPKNDEFNAVTFVAAVEKLLSEV